MKKAEIWLENSKCIDIKYETFTSEAIEQAYFFMDDENNNVAVVPWRYLITFEKPIQEFKRVEQ
tara:strand:+ start:1003 stop:1194 length:192 start_codon:yes stop_codon:yes gene_type:complete